MLDRAATQRDTKKEGRGEEGRDKCANERVNRKAVPEIEYISCVHNTSLYRLVRDTPTASTRILASQISHSLMHTFDSQQHTDTSKYPDRT